MAMKDFDWKQFMMQKGERVALGVAGLLTLLLLLFNVKSFLNAGPKKNAEELKGQTAKLQNLLATNKPTKDDDKPKPAESALQKFKVDSIFDPSIFQMASFFFTNPPENSTRRQPELFTPVEGKVALVQGQLYTYLFEQDKAGNLMVKVKKMEGAPMGADAGADARNRMRQQMQQPRGGQGGAGDLLGRGRGFGDTSVREFVDLGSVKGEFVPVESLDQGNYTLLRTIRPTPMAIIAASFPFKREVEEFQKKLGKKTIAEVLQELSLDEAEDPFDGSKRPLDAFRFTGVVLERRTVDRQGKPLFPTAGPDRNGYEEIKVVDEYKPLLVYYNLQTEPEDEKLADVMQDGLVMPRLFSAREGQYPAIETELTTIQKTLKMMQEERKKKDGSFGVQLGRSFTADRWDPFQGGSSRVGGQNQGARAPMNPMGMERGPRPTGRPIGGPRGGPMGNPGAPIQDDKLILPEYCLIRVVDVTVQPGQSYQYRLRVRMGNPNYARNDLADPNDAPAKELSPNSDQAKKWFEIPGFVTVPTDLHYYALDQKELDGNKYEGRYKDAKVGRDQTVLQIHKFLDNASPVRNRNIPVGEWCVAERVIVSRGEVIDRKVRVEVPLFVEEFDDWRLASTPSSNPDKAAQRESGIDVSFESARPAILVDFDNAKTQYKHGSETVTDNGAQEVLILSPDGKLMAHNTGVDAKDKASDEDRKNGKEGRIDRYEAWKKRIADLKNKDKGDPMNPMNPMNPMGPRGNPFQRGPGAGPGR